MNASNKGIIAFAITVCLITASLFSAAFILAYADHSHDFDNNHSHGHDGAGETCVVCAEIQAAGNLLKQMGAAVCGASFALACYLSTKAVLSAVSSPFPFQTPVDMKTRMNN